ncbi:DUF2316 family protein [Enterococcus thailandicus]|uniref:DUF2316 family protein n=1 Tax=Enterococcus TaxID=1350 RepID=UPI0022EBC410|nr:DUF2316 family protein [Enterococcus thailandicus]MDA3965197.1 DUF2316 family protein [Enterococcus thailandicus]
MSLTKQQQINTLNEFQENFALLGSSTQEIADELRTSPEKVEAILLLQPATIEEPWILKNYLIEKLIEQGKTPIPFSALIGDYHDYWFLDTRKIEKRILTD